MIALDASALIALLDPQDEHHTRAREVLGVADLERMVLSAVTLGEVLVRPAEVEKGEQAHRAILDLGVQVVSAPEPGSALRLAELRAATRLKLPDCCVLLAAEMTRATAVVSFDERLTKAAAALGYRTS